MLSAALATRVVSLPLPYMSDDVAGGMEVVTDVMFLALLVLLVALLVDGSRLFLHSCTPQCSTTRLLTTALRAAHVVRVAQDAAGNGRIESEQDLVERTAVELRPVWQGRGQRQSSRGREGLGTS